METTNNITTVEFDELRQQFLTLQQRLDRQVEINDRQLRYAIRQGLGQIRNRDRQSIAVCFVGWIVVCLGSYYLKLSLPFQIFIGIAMGINFLNSIFLKLHAVSNNPEILSSANMVRISQQLLRYKRIKRQYLLFVSIPFLIIFVTWYFYELILLMGPEATTMQIMAIIIPCIIGGIIGGAIGLCYFYLPSIRQANEMLERIEELQREG